MVKIKITLEALLAQRLLQWIQLQPTAALVDDCSFSEVQLLLAQGSCAPPEDAPRVHQDRSGVHCT